MGDSVTTNETGPRLREPATKLAEHGRRARISPELSGPEAIAAVHETGAT